MKIIFFFLFFSLIFAGLFSWRSHIPFTAPIIVSPLGSSTPLPTPTSSLYSNVLGISTSLHTADNDFSPSSTASESLPNDLLSDVDAYIVFDRDTKDVLYGKHITRKLPIASLTKIITAIVALENAPLDLELYVSSHAATVGEATMGLTAGEIITVDDALYGMMLPSGNDAAETLAEGVGKYKLGSSLEDIDGGGARAWFLERMNKKMQDLGLFDSFFHNPSGLDEDSLSTSNFSTALDMVIITNYALSNSTFLDISDTDEHFISYMEGKHKAFYLYNILQLDRSYPGIRGVKPGISEYAKETIVSYVEHDGRRIIVVLLGSVHTKDDVLAIYNTIFGTSIGVF